MKAKKLKRLDEENETFPDTDKFKSSSINQKKKQKIELWIGKVLKSGLYITASELFTTMHIYENKT